MRKLILSTALTLALVLTAAGCGGEDTASAHRNDGENNSVVLQNEARGGPKAENGLISNGKYRADDHGRVGEHNLHTDDEGQKTDLGRDLKDAGEDLMQDTKNAMDDMGKAVKDGTDRVMDDAMDNGPGEGKNPNVNAGNSSNPSVN